jgi:hypothetical protein
MKPLQVSLLILAALLFFAGLYSVIWPQAGVLVHPTNGPRGFNNGNYVEVIGTTGARGYGIIAIVIGSGLASLAIYRDKNEPPSE